MNPPDRNRAGHCEANHAPVDLNKQLIAIGASAECLEERLLNVNQALLYRPGDPGCRPFTQEYIYLGADV